MMRLIVNPASRAGRSRARRDFWLRELARRGARFEVSETRGEGHARELARTALEPVLVAVGGDGTINEVLDGALQAPAPKTLGVLYAGTSPDFCRFHGIPHEDPAAALDLLLAGRPKRVDAARVWAEGVAAAHFACGCNVGLGSDVAAFANRHRRHVGDAAGTALGLLLAACGHRRFSARLTIDGARRDIPDANHILILKSPHIASGLRLDVPLAPDDGALAVLVVRGLSRLSLLRLLPAFYTGRAVRHPAVQSFFGRAVLLEALPQQAVEYDGDPRGRTPVTAELLPRALSLICEAPHA